MAIIVIAKNNTSRERKRRHLKNKVQWSRILLACEQSLIHEIERQWYQKYSLEENKCTTKLMKIISSLCNDDNNDDFNNVSANFDNEYNSDCIRSEYHIKFGQENEI